MHAVVHPEGLDPRRPRTVQRRRNKMENRLWDRVILLEVSVAKLFDELLLADHHCPLPVLDMDFGLCGDSTSLCVVALQRHHL